MEISDMINKVIQGDSLEVLKTLPTESVDCVMTSPPYWALRDYGVDGQLGLEPTFDQYINNLCNIFDEVKRVLKKSGTVWVNLGDTYGGTGNKGNYKDPKYPNGRNGQSKALNKSATQKSLCLIPMRFAIEMQNRGWIVRNVIVWSKPNCMPSSVKDRFTVDFEYIFFFVKSKKYYFEQQLEPLTYGYYERTAENGMGNGELSKSKRFGSLNPNGRNKRSVWTITTKPFKEAHFAVYPEALCETPIKAGCPKGGVVLDPFFGAGTTGVVAKKLGRQYIGIELNPDYVKIAEARLSNIPKKLTEFSTQVVTK